jgi:hypothetical protein
VPVQIFIRRRIPRGIRRIGAQPNLYKEADWCSDTFASEYGPSAWRRIEDSLPCGPKVRLAVSRDIHSVSCGTHAQRRVARPSDRATFTSKYVSTIVPCATAGRAGGPPMGGVCRMTHPPRQETHTASRIASLAAGPSARSDTRGPPRGGGPLLLCDRPQSMLRFKEAHNGPVERAPRAPCVTVGNPHTARAGVDPHGPCVTVGNPHTARAPHAPCASGAATSPKGSSPRRHT